MSGPPVVGVQPILVGEPLQAIVTEAFVANGELVSNANVVFFRSKHRWHRLVLDAGVVHWREEPHEPKPWSVPDEGWSYPHRCVGKEFGLVGVPVTSVSLGEAGAVLQFVMAFANGRRFILDNRNDRSSYYVA